MRRKLQQDRNTQARSSRQAERKMMVTQQATPQMEEKLFSEAEMELFSAKYAKYQEAANEVNEFLDFLKKQHGISGEASWQLGQRGFVRAKMPSAPPPPAPKKSKAKRGKATPLQQPSSPMPNDNPMEDHAPELETIHQNGAGY